jgi:hypothetical protein
MNSKMKVLTIFFLNNIKAVFVVSYKMYMNYERIWQYSIVFFLVNRGYWWLDMTVVLGSMLLIIAEVHLFTPTLTLFEHEIRIYSFPSFAILSLLLFFLFFFLTQKSILLLFRYPVCSYHKNEENFLSNIHCIYNFWCIQIAGLFFVSFVYNKSLFLYFFFFT